jgi:hypothetical protein
VSRPVVVPQLLQCPLQEPRFDLTQGRLFCDSFDESFDGIVLVDEKKGREGVERGEAGGVQGEGGGGEVLRGEGRGEEGGKMRGCENVASGRGVRKCSRVTGGVRRRRNEVGGGDSSGGK